MPSTKYILVVAAKNVPGWRGRRKGNEVSNCVTFLGLQHTKWNFAFRVTNRPPNYPNCFEKWGMKNVMQCEKKDLYSNISNPKHIKMQSQADNFRIVEERKTQNFISTLDRSFYCCKRLLKFYLIFICKYFRHKAVSSTDKHSKFSSTHRNQSFRFRIPNFCHFDSISLMNKLLYWSISTWKQNPDICLWTKTGIIVLVLYPYKCKYQYKY